MNGSTDSKTIDVTVTKQPTLGLAMASHDGGAKGSYGRDAEAIWKDVDDMRQGGLRYLRRASIAFEDLNHKCEVGHSRAAADRVRSCLSAARDHAREMGYELKVLRASVASVRAELDEARAQLKETRAQLEARIATDQPEAPRHAGRRERRAPASAARVGKKSARGRR